MPEFEITSPTGQHFRITAPEGASQEEVLRSASNAQRAETLVRISSLRRRRIVGRLGLGSKEASRDTKALSYSTHAKSYRTRSSRRALTRSTRNA